jgi:hypothetical protein
MRFWANPGRKNTNTPRPRPISFQSRPGGSVGGKYEFSGKRQDFFQFEEALKTKLATDKIDYIFDEQEITEINTDPPRPAYEPLPAGRVDEATKTRINNENSDLSKEYHALVAFKRKKRDQLKADIGSTIASIEGLCPYAIRQKITQIRIECATARMDTQFLFAETWRMLIRDHGPQGDRTASEWEDILKDLNMDRGVDTTIATFKECVTNMERTLRYNPDGTPVENEDVTLRTYRPSQERLRRFLLNTLNTAPKGSPYLRLAEDMRLAHNLNSTTEDIMTIMQDYKDNGHDTIKIFRPSD